MNTEYCNIFRISLTFFRFSGNNPENRCLSLPVQKLKMNIWDWVLSKKEGELRFFSGWPRTFSNNPKIFSEFYVKDIPPNKVLGNFFTLIPVVTSTVLLSLFKFIPPLATTWNWFDVPIINFTFLEFLKCIAKYISSMIANVYSGIIFDIANIFWGYKTLKQK